MKHRLIITIVIMITAAIVITGCGKKVSDTPTGSDALPSSAVVMPDQSGMDMVEIDIRWLPAEVSKDDLVMENGRYYIGEDRLIEIARSQHKEIEVRTPEGNTLCVSQEGDIQKVRTARSDNGQEQKQDQDNQNNWSMSSGNAGTAISSNSSSGNIDQGYISSNNGGSNSGGGTSGQQTTQPVHAHSYTIYQGGTPSTCTTAGTEVYACSCGTTITNTLPLAAHSWYPVYRTEDQGWNEDIVEYHTVCFVCGAYLEGLYANDPDAFDAHLATCGGGYGGKNIVVGQQWHANPVDVFDHYECSACGARQ